ncbi:MAG: UDP-N-acetylglucosamine 4,6-dehydratase (inverting), partial [Bacteroidetes bacterium]|nr:UDP-N-acetylglucosamine 4,6-dehydratase (inverting) [Bacteroidota bacterium]
MLISREEARSTIDVDDMYVIKPIHPWWHNENWDAGRALEEDFWYGSENNSEWLTKKELKKIISNLN